MPPAPTTSRVQIVTYAQLHNQVGFATDPRASMFIFFAYYMVDCFIQYIEASL
jgi:hypothetical protein